MISVLDLLAEALDTTPDRLNEASGSDTVANWDSLRQIIIAKVIEQRCEIVLSDEDLADLTSVRSVRALLERRLGPAGVAADSSGAEATTAVADKVLLLLAEALDTSPDRLGEDSSSDTVANWDSLRQIIIAKVIEQRCDVTLSDDDLAELTSVRTIRAMLRRHGVADHAGDAGSVAEAPAKPAAPAIAGDFAALRAGLLADPSISRIFEAAETLKTASADEAWPPLRVAVLGSLTTDFIAAAIASGVLIERMTPVVYTAPYAAYVQEILDPASGLYRFKPDIVVVAPDMREATVALPIGAAREDVDAALAERTQHFETLWRLIGERTGARILQHTLVPPDAGYCGVAERRMPAAIANQVRALNDRLIETAGGRVAWIELDRLAEAQGLARWNAGRFYFTSKLAFDPQFLPLYLARFRAALRLAQGRAKKVLALDLDNTLWGGVIGDDGVAGIQLGPDTAAGEAFMQWGRYIADLAERGVILAACSKNEPELAREGLGHPHSALRPDAFAAFEVSWGDKASGLRNIAKTLNLGVDSIVFADDNPFECDLVRQAAPEVEVIELGKDPTRFIELLDAGQWFDMARYTDDDLRRSQSYQGRAAAEREREASVDIAGYLTGLGMVASLTVAAEGEVERLAQMEKKTNQFNTTTRRYGADDIARRMADPGGLVLSFRLRDRHADHGLVSSLVAARQGDVLRIDSWLMSCRVFSRSAEAFMMNGLVATARAAGLGSIEGLYEPTSRNGVVADLYPRLGFEAADGDGRTWRLPLDSPHAGTAATYVAADEGSIDGAIAAPPAAPVVRKAGKDPTAGDRDELVEALIVAQSLVEQDRRQEAQAVLDGAAEVFPHDREVLARAARLAAGRADWTGAAERWGRLRRNFADDLEGHIQGADALLRAGEIEAADILIAQMRRRLPDEIWGDILHAELPYHAGDLDEGYARFDALSARHPHVELIGLRRRLVIGGLGARTIARRAKPDPRQTGDVAVLEADARPVPAPVVEARAPQRPDIGKFRKLLATARDRSRDSGRRTIVVYGSCQGATLADVLQRALAQVDGLNVYVIHAHDPAHASRITPEAVRDAVICYEQFDERPSVPMRDHLRAILPDGCRTLRYPLMTAHSFWPFDWPENQRNAPEPPRFPMGRFPYGDSIGMAVAKQGRKGEAAFDRYMTLSLKAMPDLDKLFGRDIAQLRRRDSGSDVAMADFIEGHARRQQLFNSWGHLSIEPIAEMARQLIAADAGPIGVDPAQMEPVLAGLNSWVDDLMVPIHPEVARRMALPFADEETRYLWQGNRWTFKDYMIRYIENRTDW